MKGPVAAALAGSIVAMTSLAGAQSSPSDRCDQPMVAASGAHDACLATVQAAASAQPNIGLLMAGGSPATGSAAGGLALGVLPRVSMAARVTVVRVDVPDISTSQISDGSVVGRYGSTVPGLSVDASVSLTGGVDLAPGIGGIGGVSLLGSVGFLPLATFADEFDKSNFAYGVGARLNLLDESFVVPAVSVFVMRRAASTVVFGDVCRTTPDLAPGSPAGIEVGSCSGSGDAGEIGLDLVDWSGRATVGKHFAGIGATAGIGYDRYASDLDFGFRAPSAPGPEAATVFRVGDERLTTRRWLLFGGISYSLFVATISAEAGWQGSGSPVSGFEEIGTAFDADEGTWFGGLGVRLAL